MAVYDEEAGAYGCLCGGSAVVQCTASVVASGGAAPSGSSSNTGDLAEVPIGGAVASGRAIVTGTDTLKTYHRYLVGDEVYVLSIIERRYLRTYVTAVYASGSEVYYDIGDESPRREQFLLSPADYRALTHRSPSIRRPSGRALSALPKLR